MREDSWVPYRTTSLDAKRILALAAHPDDEVAGAGGALALAARSAEAVHVWIATDGARQEGVPAGGEAAYGERRREESRKAASRLGLPPPTFGGLPDRGLSARSEDLRREIRRLFDEIRPDLVFAPSPAEVHPDHRALAAALYECVASSRAGDPDHDAYRFVRVAFYEISHPLLPNALVDVASVAALKEQAMSEYVSQQAVRDYAGAVAGLNAYRRITVTGKGPVEAFRLVDYEAVSTRSIEEFRRAIGPAVLEDEERADVPVGVVVRTRNRPALLAEALESLSRQTRRPQRVVVVNDGGASVEGVVARFRERLPLVLRELPRRTGRSAAANLGVAEAESELIAFLDDDDLFYPDHLERLVRAHRAGPEAVAYSDAATVVYRRDGESWEEEKRILQYSLDFDPDYLLLANYIPLHTLIIPSALLSRVGGFDESLDYSEDWDLLIRLSAETSFRHVRAVTCEYRVFEESAADPAHVPAGGDAFQSARRKILERYRSRRTDDGVARVIDRLRAQVVHWYHRDAVTRDRLVRLAQLEERAAELETDMRRLASERHAAQERIHELLRSHEEYHRQVSDLYREISRLNGVLDQIRRSGTWKLHLLLDRLRGRG